MGGIEHILYVAHPTRERGPAFERACAIAAASGAHLHLAQFDRSAAIELAGHVDPHGAWLARKQFLAERELWLAGEVAILRGRGIEASMDVAWSDRPAEDIVRHAQRLDAKFVVKDADSDRRAVRLPAGLDRELLETCPVPVMFVIPQSKGLPRRIVAALDFDDADRDGDERGAAIVATATDLVRLCDAELHLATVFDPHRHRARTLDSFRAALDAVADAHRVPTTRRHVLHGVAAERLASLADGAERDLIVFGSGRRLGLQRLRVGRTSQALMDVAECDLLAVNLAHLGETPPEAEQAFGN